MARLVDTCHSNEHFYGRRQMPIVDDCLTMILQFPDICTGCDEKPIYKSEFASFEKKYRSLNSEELEVALIVNTKDLYNQLSVNVPCVGCRRSVEKLLNEMVQHRYPALEPLIAKQTSVIINSSCSSDAKSLYSLLYVHGPHPMISVELTPKTNRMKRCLWHSMDTHKTKNLWTWREVWDVSSQECRQDMLIIGCDGLHVTVETYLQKHRFCAECKNKVLRAYNLLTRELDGTSEKGFCKGLYEGLDACTREKHIHVLQDEKFLQNLIERAEPELSGNIRERHAKTLDVAQEEILTCVGIHLFERFYRVLQKLRIEERAWQYMFSLSVDALRKNFETAVERKQGFSSFDLICQELIEEQKAKGKRSKRKKKKSKLTTESDSVSPPSSLSSVDHEKSCSCPEFNGIGSAQTDTNHNVPTTSCKCGTSVVVRGSSKQNGCLHRNAPDEPDAVVDSCCGKKVNGVKNQCSHMKSSSRNMETFSNSDESRCQCSQLSIECRQCTANSDRQGSHHMHSESSSVSSNGACTFPMAMTLEDMLENSCQSEDEDSCGISEEEIRQFKANQKLFDCQRQELRAVLRKRFANMKERCCSPQYRVGGGDDSGVSRSETQNR